MCFDHQLPACFGLGLCLSKLGNRGSGPRSLEAEVPVVSAGGSTLGHEDGALQLSCRLSAHRGQDVCQRMETMNQACLELWLPAHRGLDPCQTM